MFDTCGLSAGRLEIFNLFELERPITLRSKFLPMIFLSFNNYNESYLFYL